MACGVRKQWTRELNGLSTSAQIAHIRKILNDLGMEGRMSLEQARDIRAQRELAQELGACSSIGESTGMLKQFSFGYARRCTEIREGHRVGKTVQN